MTDKVKEAVVAIGVAGETEKITLQKTLKLLGKAWLLTFSTNTTNEEVAAVEVVEDKTVEVTTVTTTRTNETTLTRSLTMNLKRTLSRIKFKMMAIKDFSTFLKRTLSLNETQTALRVLTKLTKQTQLVKQLLLRKALVLNPVKRSQRMLRLQRFERFGCDIE